MRKPDDLVNELRTKLGRGGLDRVEECVRTFAGEIEPRYLHDDQEPTRLFFPGIRAEPWFDPVSFDWVPGIEASFPDIRADNEALVASGGRFSPYEDPHTKELGWAGWETFSLYRGGVWNATARAKCPRTSNAIEGTPHGPREAMFAILRPGAHLTPHTGGVNVVLTCHLGIAIPDDCAISVNGETRTWEEGTVLVFDDSFMHEAWNRADAPRVVLLWDIWHPDLTLKEIAALELLMPTFDAALTTLS